MAQRGIKLDKEKLCCLICLDLLKDPLTIPCGHNYCMNCIKSHWDAENPKEIHSCPQCRQTFRTRPVLERNTMLADLVEELKKTEPQASPSDHCYAGPGDVACDFCSGRKMKALKSCLQCLVSYCEQHLQPHYESAAFEKHKLVDPSEKLQENICTRHNEVMKIFCRTDQQCICYLCSMDEHKGHDTVSAAAEMTEKQKELGMIRQKIQQRIQNREKDVKVLQEDVEAINHAADKAVRDSEKIFKDIKQQIRSRQKSEVTHVNELQEKVEQEIAELRRRDDELEQLSHTEDHTRFLYIYTSLSRFSEATDLPSINVGSLLCTEDATAAVSEVRDKLQAILGEEWTKISLTETEVDVLLPQEEPKYYNNYNKNNIYHLHPDKFTLPQILCRESLTGRCYWEVEWSGDEVFVAVAYKEISRKGDESAFGHNVKSWALQCYKNDYEFRHNNIRTSISGPQSSRVGVYLDHRAGILSFYSVSETMTLLHRVQTRFSRPLCPGLSLYVDGTCAKISQGLNTED